jgi:Mn-dependent DtxR family transcriptional regulator
MQQIRDVKVLTTIEDCVAFGKILSNARKVKLLRELCKGPISKAKIALMLEIKPSTVHEYVVELISAGLVEDYPSLADGGKSYVRMVKTKCDTITINLLG